MSAGVIRTMVDGLNLSARDKDAVERFLLDLSRNTPGSMPGLNASNRPGVSSQILMTDVNGRLSIEQLGVGHESNVFNEALVVYPGNEIIANKNSIIGAMLQLQSKNDLPKTGDVCGLVRGMAKNGDNVDITFCDAYWQATDITPGTEQGSLKIVTQQGGADANILGLVGDKAGVMTHAPTAPLDVNGDIIRLRTAKTPSTAGATGNAGDICWDSSYIYVCVAANTWKRAAINTW